MAPNFFNDVSLRYIRFLYFHLLIYIPISNYYHKMSSQDPQNMPEPNEPWYQSTLQEGQIPPATYDLLEKYSHIPRNNIEAHVTHVREKAYAIHPYPCIGQWRFLDLSISQQRAYTRVLSTLKENGHGNDRKKLFDLGCCFAQDIRKLIHDGVSSNSLYACDLKPEFLELGYDLFADRDSCKAHFFAVDVLRDLGDADEGRECTLAKLKGEIDFVYAASFFHLFSWDDQVRITKWVVQVLRPRKGSMVFGRQTGIVRGQETERRVRKEKDEGKGPIWRHDVESWKRLWDLVGEATGSKWEVWAELYDSPHTLQHWSGEGVRMLRYEVTRLE